MANANINTRAYRYNRYTNPNTYLLPIRHRNKSIA